MYHYIFNDLSMPKAVWFMYIFLLIITGVNSKAKYQEKETISSVKSHGFTYKVISKSILNSYQLTGVRIPILHEGSVADLKDAHLLQITNIDLEKITPGAFKNLSRTRYLEVSFNNKLKEIRAGVFNTEDLRNIKMMVVSENNISHIAQDAFDNMPNLVEISLSNNAIRQWNPEWFKNTRSLRSVCFTGNLIEEIPAYAFKHFRDKRLVEFSFAFGRIKRIHDDALKGLRRILTLYLDRNEIETINGNFLKGVFIRELRLNYNKIECINETDFDRVFAAETTVLKGNPLRFECKEKIRAWAKNHEDKIIEL